MRRKNFFIALASIYIIGAMLLALRPTRSFFDARYQGLPMYRGSDESHYTVRIQEAVVSPDGDTSNGIFSGEDAPYGAQPAKLEAFVGAFLQQTGLSGPIIALIVSVILAPFTIIFLVIILRMLGIQPMIGFSVPIFYFIIFLGPLARIVHQSWSLPMTLLATAAFVWHSQKASYYNAAFTGLLMGSLIYFYFWSWTFLWASAGIFCLLRLFFSQKEERYTIMTQSIVLFLVLGIVALPMIFHLYTISNNPLFHEVQMRSSVVFTREIESYPRSIALFIFCISMLFAVVRDKACRRQLLPISAMALGLFIGMHQQFVHGKILSYSTHYYPYICFVSAILLAFVWNARQKTISMYIASMLAGIFLLLALGDYGRLAALYKESDTAFSFQHLYPIVTKLSEDHKKDTVLTDRETALIIAMNTPDDVVFTEHLRHVFISTEEYSRRYCLSEIFDENMDENWVGNILYEWIAPGRDAVENYRTRNKNITHNECAKVRSNLSETLREFNVTVLLWNERLRPDWKLDPHIFSLRERGNGWSVWNIKGAER